MSVNTSSSWWQRHKKIFWFVMLPLLIAGCTIFIYIAYTYQIGWTGFNAFQGPDVQQYQPTKTLWDWLQLLVVPIVLSIAAYWFNNANSETERRMTATRDETERAIAAENQQAALLQDYLDRMSDLLLGQKFNDPLIQLETRNIARAHTLVVLPLLNDERKGRLIQFLYESQLITSNPKICIMLRNADLHDADLRNFDLGGANLSGANLSGAKLKGANLSEAEIQGACLHKADLSDAIFRKANLSEADLSEAILNGANFQDANLSHVNLSDAWLARTILIGANLSDAIVNRAKLEHEIRDTATIISDAQLRKVVRNA